MFDKIHNVNGWEFPPYPSEHIHVPEHSAKHFRSFSLLGWLRVGVSKQTTFLLQPTESEDILQEWFNCLGVLPAQDQTRCDLGSAESWSSSAAASQLTVAAVADPGVPREPPELHQQQYCLQTAQQLWQISEHWKLREVSNYPYLLLPNER